MTETMWRVLRLLMDARFKGGSGSYLALWHLQDTLGIELAGCGVNGDPALEKLVELGLIEELMDLGCRYRIVITDGER